ncbi:RHS repeat-associated core domain-containing protein [Streptomyces chartreusis]|uniref:RHS repeat-associated core domain-containing protein n=1 Tax=Streptomyces chartreusis TaxID=1969 RepID=UPI0036A18A30
MSDGFDHVVESQKSDAGGVMKSLGLSGEILDEKVSGELTKSYQYSPWGERLSQVKHSTDGTTEDGYYGYTAYGSNDDTEFTGIDKPEAGNPTKEEYNPYRFNAKRWDAQSGTYDMGFRDYDPGLNRFTTRDMYSGALADMSLGSDPFTGNRYAFTGGNPVSGVELDGHLAWFGIPLAYYAYAALFGTAAYAATPLGQQSLQDAGHRQQQLLLQSDASDRRRTDLRWPGGVHESPGTEGLQGNRRICVPHQGRPQVAYGGGRIAEVPRM